MSNEPPARIPFPFEDPASRPPGYELPPPFVPAQPAAVRRPRFQQKLGRHVLLFLLTVVSTTAAGACHYHSFVSELGQRPVTSDWSLVWNGFWYSATLLLILGAHEMGHYLFCRRYNVDATLPYFIPAPIPLTGTLGAVIRIREAFPTRTVLFDIGVAGPIAGFIVLVPAFFAGLAMSQVILAPPLSESLIELGEPLLFQWGADLVFGALPEGHTINMHPMVFAAWFGMLATALNLLPFGQLDGGHITYATLGRWSTSISMLTVGAAVAMTFVSMSWIFMTVMLVLMLVVLGPRHPRVVYEYEPLGRGRLLIALVALVMLIVCFTPVPIQPYDLMRNP